MGGVCGGLTTLVSALSAGVVELCYESSGKKDAQEQDKARRMHSRLQDHTESSSSKVMTTTREGTVQR